MKRKKWMKWVGCGAAFWMLLTFRSLTKENDKLTTPKDTPIELASPKTSQVGSATSKAVPGGGASSKQVSAPSSQKEEVVASKKSEASEVGEELGTPFPDKEIYTKEELILLKKMIEAKNVELHQDLDLQKKYLESLIKQVEFHLAKVEQARHEITNLMNDYEEKENIKLKKLTEIEEIKLKLAQVEDAKLKKISEFEEIKLKKLAQFYEAMDPEQAGLLFDKMDENLSVKIFDLMSVKKVGAILSHMSAEKAAKISGSFPRLKLQAEGEELNE